MSYTVIFLAGSYDQNTIREAPWQVHSQSANTDKCTGSQLQLACMDNQGNVKTTKKERILLWTWKMNMQKNWQKDSRVITSENAEPSCSTWHQAAPMYLPSTSYTGESINIVKMRMLSQHKEHSWQLQKLPWLVFYGCHVLKTTFSISAHLQLPCRKSCSCHFMTTAIAI